MTPLPPDPTEPADLDPAIEQALRADGLLPVPLTFLPNVMAAVRVEPRFGAVPAAHAWTGRRSLLRAAAAALAIALGAHLALGGGDAGAALTTIRDLPLPAALAPDLGLLDEGDRSTARDKPWHSVADAVPRLSDAPDLVPGSPGALLAAGAGLLAAGILLAAKRSVGSTAGRA